MTGVQTCALPISPFVYPTQPHVRRHGPAGYRQYESFRPWLGDEFSFRCVFCLRREQWDRAVSLEIDHFQPSRQFPDHALRYDNLLYACARCNSAKGDQRVSDPCETLLAGSVLVHEDGQIVGLTDAARSLVQTLRLNNAESVHFRRLWIEIIILAQQFAPDLHQQLLGFPDDLPNLSHLRPPDGNSRQDGVAQSHFAQREQGVLPNIY